MPGVVLKFDVGFGHFDSKLKALGLLANELDTTVSWVAWASESNAILVDEFLNNPVIHFENEDDLLHMLGKFLKENPMYAITVRKVKDGKWLLEDIFKTEDDDD